MPKDGPSAGITMVVAMTGEISLRGKVLPIGGLKEKLLAAKQAGMKLILIPQENERDLADISEEITAGMEIRAVSKMDEVLENALEK